MNDELCGYNASMSAASKPTRRYLRFSLRTFLVVTLALSLALGIFGRVWLKAWRDSQPPTLYELAQIAKRHGIPMPPPGAKLVLGVHKGMNIGNVPNYYPAFLLSESADGGCVLLMGANELHRDRSSKSGPDWREFSFDLLRQKRNNAWDEPGPSSMFISAVQSALVGQRERAEELLTCACEMQQTDSFHDMKIDATDLRLTMARFAFRHLACQLPNHPERWPELRKRMEALLEEFPKLQQEYHGGVFRQLALAVDAPAPPIGSVEELLLDWSRQPLQFSFSPPFELAPIDAAEVNPDYTSSEPARQIILRGFEAVPELIRLRNDRRLTTHIDGSWRESDGSAAILHLGKLANDLLLEVSGYKPGEVLSVPLSDESSAEPSDKEWRKWFESAQARGERQYLLENIFVKRDDYYAMRSSMACILASKHPDSLRPLNQTFFDSPHLELDPLHFADAIGCSTLPAQDRTALLVAFFQRAPSAVQPLVLCSLAKIDPQCAAELLEDRLDAMPSDSIGDYYDCPEAKLAIAVAVIDTPSAWSKLLAATRRALPGLRTEIFDQLSDRLSPYDVYAPQHPRPYALAFLAAFLDDDEALNPFDHFQKYGAKNATDLEGLTVRDCAVDRLAWVFDMPATRPQPKARAQWSTLREQVRERLKGEELPALE